MSFDNRKKLMRQIEEIRGRPLISYVTSIRPDLSDSMRQDSIVPFIKQLELIDEKEESIDVLILSNGGDPIVAWRLISLLRERFKNIGVIVPYSAYSAATLFALGADEIIIHPYGNLGPIDPQITFGTGMPGSSKTFSYEDLVNYIEFVKTIGLTDQELLQKCFDKLVGEVQPTTLGFAKRSSQLGLLMGEKLLSTHLDDSNRAKAISQALNTKFYNHGYSLNRKEAKELGLTVCDKGKEFNDILWKLANDYIDEYRFNTPFNIDSYIQNEIDKKVSIDTPSKIKRELTMASIESPRLLCTKNMRISIIYVISKEMEIKKNAMVDEIDWVLREIKDE